MKKTGSKQSTQTKRALRVKDIAPKKNLKSGRSDPTGNTYYVGTANGGVWKTT